MINVELPTALHPIFSSPARYRVAYGGRGSAKSWGFGRMAVVRAYEKPRRILCARELQNSIKDSVHRLLADQINELGLPGFQIGESFIRHVNGSEFIFKGLRTNASEIKSMEGIDICWVEEAQKVTEDSWNVLIPTIRAPGSEIWVTFNPEEKKDATSQRFIENPPPDALIAKVNWNQNPWFPEELRREKDYLKRVDPESYLHVWEGEYKNPNRGGRVVYAWSFANIDEGITYDPTKRIYLTCDFNVDPMCWAIAHKPLINGKNHYHFFDEIVLENSNIPRAVEEFCRRYKGHKAGIVITGDANSGRARSDMAEVVNENRWGQIKRIFSDMGMKNYEVDSNRANPLIKDRLDQFNWIVCDPEDLRRVRVAPNCKQIIYICENARKIPGTDEMWQPTPKNIEDTPSLKFDRDDMLDAISYLVWKYDPKIDKEKPQTRVRTASFKPR